MGRDAARSCRLMVVLFAAACGVANLDTPDPHQNVGLLRLIPSATADTADGARLDTLFATLDTKAVPPGVTVSFTTTLGSFRGSASSTLTVPADSTGLVKAQLQAPADSGLALITASALGVTRSQSITYVQAPPTLAQIVPATPVLSISSVTGNAVAVVVSVTLLRPTGSPSPGWFVHLAAVDALGHVHGSFNADSLEAVGDSVKFNYVASDKTFFGNIYLSAAASRGSTSKPLQGTATLTVTP